MSVPPSVETQAPPSDPAPLVIESRVRDLGGFSVRRALPSAEWRLVGPFILFDHMGPTVLAPGQPPLPEA